MAEDYKKTGDGKHIWATHFVGIDKGIFTYRKTPT